LRALKIPVYAIQVMNERLYELHRDGRMRTLFIDTIEAKFKLAVEMQKSYPFNLPWPAVTLKQELR
jgi:hypothetical protein